MRCDRGAQMRVRPAKERRPCDARKAGGGRCPFRGVVVIGDRWYCQRHAGAR